MDTRYACLECDWHTCDSVTADEAAALSHFVETGHSIEALSVTPPRQGWRRRIEDMLSWR